MDGMLYCHLPNSPSLVDDVKAWLRPLCWTAVSIVLVLGGILALDMVGLHIPVVDEFPSGTPRL